jgi:hypothetical protein
MSMLIWCVDRRSVVDVYVDRRSVVDVYVDMVC